MFRQLCFGVALVAAASLALPTADFAKDGRGGGGSRGGVNIGGGGGRGSISVGAGAASELLTFRVAASAVRSQPHVSPRRGCRRRLFVLHRRNSANGLQCVNWEGRRG